MQIHEFKLKELKGLLTSAAFQQTHSFPITPLRALSQYHNPRAKPEAIVLLVATDKTGDVISYVGCLPDHLAQDQSIPVAWNSCWWRHPEKGKRIALPLLLRAIQLWEGRMLFDDLPAHSTTILEKMGGFSFRKIVGLRCFLAFKFHKILPQKKASLVPFTGLLRGVDFLLNASWYRAKKTWWRRSRKQESLRIESVTKIDEPTGSWITAHATQELIGRNRATLNWILAYPWLSTQPKDKEIAARYYFSSVATVFKNLVYKLWKGEKLVAVLFFTNRDHQLKLPYVYFEKEVLPLVVDSILEILIEQQAESFVCFQKEICECMTKMKTLFYYQKEIEKTFGIAESLEKYLVETPVIQDGDGDWVFT
ncbi:MAG: hypothetical protein AB8G15_04790 [Saprospiraceae bacterium]